MWAWGRLLLGLAPSACLVENPAWGATDGSSSIASTVADSSGGPNTTPEGTGTLSATTLSTTTQPHSTTAGTSSTGRDETTTGPASTGGLDCTTAPVSHELSTAALIDDFAIAATEEGVLVSILAGGTLDIWRVRVEDSSLVHSGPLMGSRVLVNWRPGELALAVDANGPSNALLYRVSLATPDLTVARGFAVPVFPLKGLLRGDDAAFTILTRELEGSNSPAYLSSFDGDDPEAAQVDGPLLTRYGHSTWLVAADDGDDLGWAVFRRTQSSGCVALAVGPDGEVVEAWDFADECFDPDIAPFDGGAVVGYHRTEGDRNAYGRILRPEEPASIPVGFGVAGVDENDVQVAARGGDALFLWWSDQKTLGAAVLDTETLAAEPIDADFGSSAGRARAFASSSGPAGVVYRTADETLRVSFLCESVDR